MPQASPACRQRRGRRRESAERKGREGWRFTLHAPDYFAVMTYLDDAAIRRQVYEAFSVRATEAARQPPADRAHSGAAQREARLLGYANFADLVLEDRMAHDGARALAFLDDLKVKTRPLPRGESRAARIPAVARRPSAPNWRLDVATTRKSNAPRCTISTKKLCGHTSAGTGVAGLFDLVHRLYGLRIEQEAGAPVWDEAVRYYNVHDESGEFLAASTPIGSARKQARRRLDGCANHSGPEGAKFRRIWGWSAAT